MRWYNARLLFAVSVLGGLANAQPALAGQAHVVGTPAKAVATPGSAALPAGLVAVPLATAGLRLRTARSRAVPRAIAKRPVRRVVNDPPRALSIEGREINRARVASLLILGIGY